MSTTNNTTVSADQALIDVLIREFTSAQATAYQNYDACLKDPARAIEGNYWRGEWNAFDKVITTLKIRQTPAALQPQQPEQKQPPVPEPQQQQTQVQSPQTTSTFGNVRVRKASPEAPDKSKDKVKSGGGNGGSNGAGNNKVKKVSS